MKPFYKLFNAGTSEGVKKGWESRKNNATGYVHDAYVGKVHFGPGGISASAILHPEHVEQVAALKSGQATYFKDEQGKGWHVNRDHDGNTHFETMGSGAMYGHVPSKLIEDHDQKIHSGGSFPTYPTRKSDGTITRVSIPNSKLANGGPGSGIKGHRSMTAKQAIERGVVTRSAHYTGKNYQVDGLGEKRFGTVGDAIDAHDEWRRRQDAQSQLDAGAKAQLDRGQEEQLNRSAEEFRQAQIAR